MTNTDGKTRYIAIIREHGYDEYHPLYIKLLKAVEVPPGQSLDFDEGGARREWLNPYLGSEYHLVGFVELLDGETLAFEVIAERRNQIAAGYGPWHDDAHKNGEIITAGWGALARINAALNDGRRGDNENYTRRLIQAAALVSAEVDRVKRALDRQP